MHVHAEVVANVMRVDLGDDVVDRGTGAREVLAIEELVLEHGFTRELERLVVEFDDRGADSAAFEHLQLHVQHGLIDGALRRREAAVGGPGARNVAREIVVLAAGVHQHQVAVAHNVVVRDVVERVGARAAGHHRWVREALCAAKLALVLDHAAEHVLGNVGARAAHGLDEGLGADGGGLGGERHLGLGLGEAHTLDDRRQVLVAFVGCRRAQLEDDRGATLVGKDVLGAIDDAGEVRLQRIDGR